MTQPTASAGDTASPTEAILLTALRLLTFNGSQPLTNASGFFFEREQRLYLVTSRHVLIDAANGHHPDRLEIELHLDPANMADSTGFSIPLYKQRKSVWRDGSDGGGTIDVAVLPINRAALPANTTYLAYGPQNLVTDPGQAEVGDPILVVGFPLGFHDALHHTPVVRQAGIASSFGLRFQGKGYFLADGRTHRGSSGAPVIKRMPAGHNSELPWWLLGVHSARMDIGTRDLQKDEALGLNCVWYADILLTLTED